MWDIIEQIAPQLDSLQHKGETICAENPASSEQYWEKVAENILELTEKLESEQVWTSLRVESDAAQTCVAIQNSWL